MEIPLCCVVHVLEGSGRSLGEVVTGYQTFTPVKSIFNF